MRRKLLATLCLAVCSLVAHQANAAIVYTDPPTGWTYTYTGDGITNSASPTTTLDGNWNWSNGSSQFDGSTNGGTFSTNTVWGQGNGPGGLTQNTEGGVSYVRWQDCGDPRLGGFKDPENRKLAFLYDMGTLNGATASQSYDGITLEFRCRIPTPSNTAFPLDPIYPAVGTYTNPVSYPATGDGYVTWDGGKGNIFIHDQVNGPTDTKNQGSSIAFSLTQTTDNNGNTTNQAGFAGLTMNEFAGNVIGDASVNFGGGTGTNLVACDPTQWHEFWIVLKADPAGLGTHQAYIYKDGSLTPKIIKLTAGNSDGGADNKGHTYIGMGSPATGQSCAFDLNYIQFYLGEVYPNGAINLLPPQVVNATPAYTQPFYPVSSNLVVEAVTYGTNSIPTSGATLTLNGSVLGVSATGSAQDRTFTYSGLAANTQYQGQIIISDQAGRSTTNNIAFDTFTDAGDMVIEAEDYNYSSGQFIDNPAPGVYATQVGTPLVDYVDSSMFSPGNYRSSDAVDTYITADLPRQKFITAAAQDYDVELIARGEWLNYTRTIAAGSYNAYLRCGAAAAQDVRLDVVTGNSTTSNQPVAFLGTFHVPNSGSVSAFQNAGLSDVQGNPLRLELSGVTTLRLTAKNANNNLNINYLVLVPASAAAAPVVSASPDANATGVMPNASIEAAIYDGSSPVDPNSVVLTVNGSVVTIPTPTKSGGLTKVKYTPASLWPVLSYNTVNLAYNDGTARNASWSFTVAYMPSLTSSMKVTDSATSGFVWRVFQNDGDLTATTGRAANELAGTSGLANNADPNSGAIAFPQFGDPLSPGNGPITFNIPTVINMSSLGTGIYGYQYGNMGPDDPMPGLPSLVNNSKNGIAADASTFVQLPAGVVTMTVNSDDGFKLSAGYLSSSPLVLLDVEGQHTPEQDNVTSFIVQQAGVYAFDLLWYQGDHDYAIEWCVINTNGTYALVNDTANGAPAAFQSGTVPTAPPRPTLSIQYLGGGQIKLTWSGSGVLQVSSSPVGGYVTVPGAASPYTTTPGGNKYYRIFVQ